MSSVKCPYCGSSNVRRCGKHPRQQYQCTDPKHPEGTRRYFTEERPIARVLLFDIETLPMQVYAWKFYDRFIGPQQVKQDWAVLSYSAKWLFQPEVYSSVMTVKEALAYDDTRLTKEIWKLFDEADIIIAHYGDHFDVPRMNVRFLFHHLGRPSPYQTIDTRDTAAKAFGFSSNSLDYLGEYLGLGRKHKTDFDWWRECVEGKQEALDRMHKYNHQDVFLLEDVYVELRPWIKHPNMALYMDIDDDREVCPRCGSDDIEIDEKHSYRTNAGIFSSFHCKHCGGWARAKSRYGTSALRGI